jgi:SCY1-like protein 1
MPRTGTKSSPALGRADKLRSETPVITRSYSDQPVEEYKDEDNEDVFDAWADMDDDDGQAGEQNKTPEDGEDTFFDAAQTPRSPASSVAAATPVNPFDDGGEPDFAGWLAAQSKPKAKKPLPKGLSSSASKAPSSTKSPVAARPTSAASKPVIVRPKPVTSQPKKIDTKPKEETMDEEGWGDAWD